MDLNKVTEEIIRCAFTVANVLGVGFLEKTYENALAHELRKAGLSVEQQKLMRVFYDGVPVGDYCADLLVQGSVVVELRVVKSIDEVHVAQCLNCLKTAGLKVCLLINFGAAKIQIKRIVHGP
jgi:GxxExxY protein